MAHHYAPLIRALAFPIKRQLHTDSPAKNFVLTQSVQLNAYSSVQRRLSNQETSSEATT